MIFRIINNKGKTILLVTCTMLVITIIASFNGCTSSYNQQIEPDMLNKQEDYKIVKVVLKDGKELNLKNQLNKFFKIYEDKKNVIVNRSSIISADKRIIELNNARAVIIEKEEMNVTYTILGATLGLAVAAGIIVILSALVWETGFPF